MEKNFQSRNSGIGRCQFRSYVIGEFRYYKRFFLCNETERVLEIEIIRLEQP